MAAMLERAGNRVFELAQYGASPYRSRVGRSAVRRAGGQGAVIAPNRATTPRRWGQEHDLGTDGPQRTLVKRWPFARSS